MQIQVQKIMSMEMCAYAAFARTVSGSMHDRHQLCKEGQHNEEEQIQGQVSL